MQQQICPRCKFRLTSAKAICNTCGYSLHSVRRTAEPAPVAPKAVSQNSNSSLATNNVRKAQASVQTGGAGSFWRTFFGLDPLPAEKTES